MPGADEWRTSDVWPPEGSKKLEWSLRADGALGDDQGAPGERSLMVLGEGLGRARPSDADPPTQLAWTSEPLTEALDVAGDLEAELHASATAADTAWIVTLQDVAPDDTAVDVTAGWLRASLRGTDPDADAAGPPELPVANPRASSRVWSPLIGSHSSPTPEGSPPGIASGLWSPATTRTTSPPPSWDSATRPSARAAGTPSVRRRARAVRVRAARPAHPGSGRERVRDAPDENAGSDGPGSLDLERALTALERW